MANNFASRFWKHSLSQNLNPAALMETFNANILQKLGLSWVLNHAPVFFINSNQASIKFIFKFRLFSQIIIIIINFQIEILHEPHSFYNLLLRQIENANERIVLSSLYLGTGLLEKNLVQVLQKRLQEKPNLKVKILLDCTRGSRGKINSRQMLLPLLKNFENSCKVC